jgi:hypothetical protein
MEIRYNEVTIGKVNNKWKIEWTGNCSQYHHEIQIAFWFKSDAPLSFPKVVLWGQMMASQSPESAPNPIVFIVEIFMIVDLMVSAK